MPLGRIADALGTPVWVYSAGTMRTRLSELTAALQGLDARIHYAVKANDHLAVLRVFGRDGAGADVVSEGELRRARARRHCRPTTSCSPASARAAPRSAWRSTKASPRSTSKVRPSWR